MNNFRCPKCNFLNFGEAESCKRCKIEFDQNTLASAESSTSFGQNPNQQYSENNSAPPRQNFGQTQYAFGSQSGATSFPQNNLNSDEDKKTGMAIASLVLGIIGFFTAGLLGIGAVIGVILGAVSLRRTSNNPAEYGGKGLAIAGIALNCLSFVGIFFIGIIAAIAIPNLLAARRAANEGSTIASMRTIMQAEADFMRSSATKRCGDLTDLFGAKLIDTNLAGGEKSGYKYVIAKNANGSCELFAAPLVANGVGKTGTRSFYASTEEWEIRAADKNGAAASKNDPKLSAYGNGSVKTRQNSLRETDY